MAQSKEIAAEVARRQRGGIDNDELDRFLTESVDLSPEATTHFPDLMRPVMGPDAYLMHIAKCKQAVRIPIIASLNGTTTGGWLAYARCAHLAARAWQRPGTGDQLLRASGIQHWCGYRRRRPIHADAYARR